MTYFILVLAFTHVSRQSYTVLTPAEIRVSMYIRTVLWRNSRGSSLTQIAFAHSLLRTEHFFLSYLIISYSSFRAVGSMTITFNLFTATKVSHSWCVSNLPIQLVRCQTNTLCSSVYCSSCTRAVNHFKLNGNWCTSHRRFGLERVRIRWSGRETKSVT